MLEMVFVVCNGDRVFVAMKEIFQNEMVCNVSVCSWETLNMDINILTCK